MSAGIPRNPHLLGSRVVFAAGGHIWCHELGGATHRVSDGVDGEADLPQLSPDGTKVAYSVSQHGSSEVWVSPVDGGRARRLTFLGRLAHVRGWSSQGRIRFATDHWGLPRPDGLARPWWTQIAEVGPAGGEPVRLTEQRAYDYCESDAGVLLGRNTFYTATDWLGYRGGLRGRVWSGEAGGPFRELDPLGARMWSPVWAGSRIAFVSDADGNAAVHSVARDGTDLRRHFDGPHPVRSVTCDGDRAVAAAGAALWCFDLTAGEPAELPIDTTAPVRRRSPIRASDIRTFTANPAGDTLALTARGHVFTVHLPTSEASELPVEAGEQVRAAHWIDDRFLLLQISARGAGPDLLRRVDSNGGSGGLVDVDADLGQIERLEVSPDQRRVAIANHRLELLIIDLDSGRVTEVDVSELNPDDGHRDLSWHPDGTHLAYSRPTSVTNRKIVLYALDSGQHEDLTPGEFHDFAPQFSRDGESLFFLSRRSFDPRRDEVLHSGLAVLHSSIALCCHLATRAVRQTTAPSGPYTGLRRIGRQVLAISAHSAGVLGSRSEPPPRDLIAIDHAPHTPWSLPKAAAHIRPLGDGDRGILRRGSAIVAFELGTAAEFETILDLDVVRGEVDLRQERLAEIDRVANDVRRFFWRGAPAEPAWSEQVRRHAELMEHAVTDSESRLVLRELLACTSTSHADIRPVPVPPGTAEVASLGIDVVPRADGALEITRILTGDEWSPTLTSPLAARELDVREGDLIIAVNGVRTHPDVSLGQLLATDPDRAQLVLSRHGVRRDLEVTPLRSEQWLRERQWVEENRAYVHEITGGRVGYIKLPDTSARGYAEFQRYWPTERTRDGLIVDLRFNGGGGIGHLLLDLLAREPLGHFRYRWGREVDFPFDGTNGPIVLLVNELTKSNAEITTHLFMSRRLGTVVGARTWGGVVGIRAREPLHDGSLVWVPEEALVSLTESTGIEGRGVLPDLDVDTAAPGDEPGADRQLAEAIRVVTDRLDSQERRP